MASVLASRMRQRRERASRCAPHRRGRQLHHRFLVGSRRADLALHAALAHHHDRSASARISGRSLDTTRQASAVARLLADDLVNLILGADVHALGRLIEKEHAWLIASHRASTTFCWLPPLSRSGVASIPGALMFQPRSSPLLKARSSTGCIVPPGRRRARQHQVVTQREVEEEAPAADGLPARARRRRAWRDGCCRLYGASPTNTSPPPLCSPKIVSSNSERPEPTRPNSPTISPRATSRVTSLTAGAPADGAQSQDRGADKSQSASRASGGPGRPWRE